LAVGNECYEIHEGNAFDEVHMVEMVMDSIIVGALLRVMMKAKLMRWTRAMFIKTIFITSWDILSDKDGPHQTILMPSASLLI
jgi:hypothetical protein